MNAPEMNRLGFIGGSDVAAILGVSPWKTPHELWLQKTGRAAREEITPQQQKRFDRGHRLEPVVLDMLLDRLRDDGHEVELLRTNERYIDTEHPFMACEIDFELMLDGEHVNGDCKTVHPFAAKKWGEEGTDEVPIEYAAQFMHGLGITGRDRCIVATLIGMDDLLIYEVQRDQETIDGIRTRVAQYWNECVIADVPPDPIDFDDAKAIYAKADGTKVEATSEIRDAVFTLAQVKQKLKSFEESEKELSFRIADFMRPHSILTFGGNEIATWKNQDHTSLDQKLLAEEMPEVTAQYKRTKEIRVLRLKVKIQ
ncbi:endonuclease [Paraburkholderia madseniana]|uniref:Endonuclease n=1 Tax=Paraburkholderia madseniana TaxID=2599607 RepID=A0A6N6W9M9_9BURK|nr:YqaJ viral recombinase family protein [Paraburkholderia madseniana]KAE8757352.1 endonuclease [Paraburkholderia madseniana]